MTSKMARPQCDKRGKSAFEGDSGDMAASVSPDGQSESLFSKFSNALSSAYRRLMGTYESQICCGRTVFDMPEYRIAPLYTSVIACCTGPSGGICQLEADTDAPTHPPEGNVAGVVCWNQPQTMADGDSVTLYDLKEGSTSHHGDPIADVFAILARPNSCILAVADGCGWGTKPRLAARCAVRGSIEHLNSKLFQMTSEQTTTHDIFHAMYRAMHSAQKCIIEHGGTTTTLCLAVVVELAEPKAGNKWGVCVVSVGDSVCYVWRHNMEEVHEITMAFAEGQERNQMDAGGCLGADMGDHPDLTNLHCCYAPLADNDIVFLVSDGVSDNFDPVTLREAIPESCIVTSPGCTSPPPPFDISPLSSVPALSPIQRKHLATMRMSTLMKDTRAKQHSLNATNVKETVRNYSVKITEEKRGFLEQVGIESLSRALTPAERRVQDKRIGNTVKQLPGKLDHATIAVYQVGRLITDVPEDVRRTHSPTHPYVFNRPTNDHVHNRTHTLDSYSGGNVHNQVV